METLSGLGATTVFGLPGQHALGMFDALRRSSLQYIGLRVENNAGSRPTRTAASRVRPRPCCSPPARAR